MGSIAPPSYKVGENRFLIVNGRGREEIERGKRTNRHRVEGVVIEIEESIQPEEPLFSLFLVLEVGTQQYLH